MSGRRGRGGRAALAIAVLGAPFVIAAAGCPGGAPTSIAQPGPPGEGAPAVDAAMVDAGSGGPLVIVAVDAGPAPADVDAAPLQLAAEPMAQALLDSVLQFPSTAVVVRDFSPGELENLVLDARGFNNGGGNGVGNADAPLGGSFAALMSSGQTMYVRFSRPVHAVGLSAMDIDFGFNEPVTVKLLGLDAQGAAVIVHRAIVEPAHTWAEENERARFVGWTTPDEVVAVQITIDGNNSTALDNLRFAY